MTQSSPDTASVVERARHYQADATIVAAYFLGDCAVFVLGEEALLMVRDGASAHGDSRRVAIHGGAMLAAAADAERVVTGGDDGRVVATDAAGTSTDIAADPKQRWIDHVAIGPDGAVAWSAGKQAFVRSAKGASKGAEQMFEAPSTVGALAFSPKGFRLAVSHYNGATLWFPNAAGATPETLAWRGSHLAASFSPDGRFLITAMQEPTLHGWRLADHKDMRMQGYGARSFARLDRGRQMAGELRRDPVILWPFQAKDGPIGKTRKCSRRPRRQSSAGRLPPAQGCCGRLRDGLILLVRLPDGPRSWRASQQPRRSRPLLEPRRHAVGVRDRRWRRRHCRSWLMLLLAAPEYERTAATPRS